MNKHDVAVMLGCNRSTVDDWIRKGLPVATRGGLGKPWTFDRDAVLAWKQNKDRLADEANERRMHPLRFLEI